MINSLNYFINITEPQYEGQQLVIAIFQCIDYTVNGAELKVEQGFGKKTEIEAILAMK